MTVVARRSLHAAEPQAVTFVELFFDLVFVFAVTQVTALTARNLTPDGVLRSVVLFWLIWWAWTQFTWTLNPADSTHWFVRVVTLTATAATFVMAASVPRAFENDASWFALPYVTVRLLGLGLQVAVDRERTDEDRGGIWRWAGGSGVVLLVVLVGAVADSSIRPAIWLLVIALDLLSTQAARGRTWDIAPGHIAERHALFVIIALGESLVLAGTAVAGQERTTALVVDVAAILLIACVIWWTYFAWFKEALEEHLSSAPPHEMGVRVRDAYSVAHLPMLAGIIGFAVGVEEILAHPADPLPAQVLVALAVGVALFVGSSVLAFWLLSRRVLIARLVAIVAMAAGLFLVAGLPPVGPLAVVAVTLSALVLWEARRQPA